MSKIEYKEFQDRFKFIKEFETDQSLLKKREYRDVLERINVISIEYINLTLEERKKIFAEFTQLHNPQFCLRIVCYTEKLEGATSNLIFLFEEAKTLESHLYDETQNKFLTLEFNEVIYVFKCMVKALKFYHRMKISHGSLMEKNVYVDKNLKIKIMMYPNMQSNIDKAAYKLSLGHALTKSGLLLSPEEFTMLKNRFDPKYDFSKMRNNNFKNDIFCIGLMCVRIINPTGFYAVYDMINFEINFEKLYSFLETLGFGTNHQFCAMLKNCLAVDYDYRPTVKFLSKELHEIGESSVECLKEQAYDADEIIIDFGDDMFSEYSYDDLKTAHDDQSTTAEFLEHSNQPNQFRYEYPGVKTITLEKQITKVKRAFSPNKFSFTGKNPLIDAKKTCMNFLESKIYENLPFRKSIHKNFGELTYKIKVLGNNKRVGFILYPNGDVYFGFLHQLRRHSYGIYILKNFEVYHGEFKEGKIEGFGTYTFNNGDVFQGDWENNLLHGRVFMFSRSDNSHYVCTFSEGDMTHKAVDELSIVSDISIFEIFTKYVNKTKIVQCLSRDFIIPVSLHHGKNYNWAGKVLGNDEGSIHLVKDGVGEMQESELVFNRIYDEKSKNEKKKKKVIEEKEEIIKKEVKEEKIEEEKALEIVNEVSAKKEHELDKEKINEEIVEPSFDKRRRKKKKKISGKSKEKRKRSKRRKQVKKNRTGRKVPKLGLDKLKRVQRGQRRTKRGSKTKRGGGKTKRKKKKTNKKNSNITIKQLKSDNSRPHLNLHSLDMEAEFSSADEDRNYGDKASLPLLSSPKRYIERHPTDGGNGKTTKRKKQRSMKKNIIKTEKSQSQKETIDLKRLDLVNPNSYTYRGKEVDGLFEGFGHLFFDIGDRFFGNFCKGLPDGEGTFLYKTGEIIEGIWIKGRLQEITKKFDDEEDEENSIDVVVAKKDKGIEYIDLGKFRSPSSPQNRLKENLSVGDFR